MAIAHATCLTQKIANSPEVTGMRLLGIRIYHSEIILRFREDEKIAGVSMP